MNRIVNTTILLAITLLAAQYKAELVEQCKDVRGVSHRLNDSYIGPDNCNKCRCLETGSACTRKLCPRDASPRNAEADLCVDKAGVLHEVGETYTHVDGCNRCKCTEQGGACTKKFCIQEEREVRTCRDSAGTEMGIGSSWLDTDGCNTCMCGVLGPVCTEKFCGQHKQFEDGDAQIDEIVHDQRGSFVSETGDQQCRDHENKPHNPGETWLTEDSCNICSCKGDGNLPTCTKMGCRVRLARLLNSPSSSSSLSGAVLLTLLPLLAARLLD